MATAADQAYLVDAVSSLCGVLHEGIEVAREIAEGHFGDYEMTDPEYGAGTTHLTRFHARRVLKTLDLGEWEIAKPRPNGQVLLRNELLLLRILHEWPENSVPPPGHNTARIDFYRNPDLGLHGVKASKLIAVWRRAPEGEVSIRIIRPIGKWKLGKVAKFDISFPLHRSGLSDLEFVPDDSGMNVLLPFEAEEEGEKGNEQPLGG
ncbi:hypothetical protein [Actinomadura chokoriensis]|uniref:hypothetical protein n=1 Tax=Actinomadura chokoriensis TaxID=454156 RepID=UPI003561CD17